jgi:hypothetical protein
LLASNLDSLTNEDFPEYTYEQKKQWDKLYSELPMALDIILYNGNFDLGTYKSRYYLRNWIKVK